MTSPSLGYILGYKNILYSLILDKIGARDNLNILDIGCRDGIDLLNISKRGNFRSYGLDIEFRKIWITRARPKCIFMQAKAEELPFKENSIDIVICSEVIEHLSQIDKFLCEVFKVLKPDGYFFITTPSRYNYPSIIGKFVPRRFKKTLRKLVFYGASETSGIKKILADGTIVREHVYEYLPQELKGLFEKKGFKVESIRQGLLQIPLCPLFDRIPILIKLWRGFDYTISKFPFLIYIKFNFLIVAKKKTNNSVDKNIALARNILIINLGGIGDNLLSKPSLKALRNFYPHIKISMLVTPRTYDLIKDLPYITETFVFHMNYRNEFPLPDMLKNLNTLLILRKKHFDLAINMRTLVSKISALKMKFLLDIINPKIKAGRNTEGRGYFFDIKIPETNIGEKSEMEYDIELVKALGVEVVDRSIDFEIKEEGIKKIFEILKSEDVSDEDILIGIHPGGKPSHQWPIKNFSKVVDKIYKEISCKFVITGEKKEAYLANKLIKITNAKIINFVDRLSIEELGALIKRCNLFISNDTAVMHIAAVLNTPLLAIFGPGYITRFDPRHISNKAIALYRKVDCAPCDRIRCNDLKCLEAISPEEAIEASLGLLRIEKNNAI